MPHNALRDFWQQLEQRSECRRLGGEPEQLSLEFEHERRVSGGLRFLPKSRRGIAESQGCIILHYAKSFFASFLVGRPKTRRGHEAGWQLV